MRASARENAHPNVKFVILAGQADRRTQFGGRKYLKVHYFHIQLMNKYIFFYIINRIFNH